MKVMQKTRCWLVCVLSLFAGIVSICAQYQNCPADAESQVSALWERYSELETEVWSRQAELDVLRSQKQTKETQKAAKVASRAIKAAEKQQKELLKIQNEAAILSINNQISTKEARIAQIITELEDPSLTADQIEEKRLEKLDLENTIASLKQDKLEYQGIIAGLVTRINILTTEILELDNAIASLITQITNLSTAIDRLVGVITGIWEQLENIPALVEGILDLCTFWN